MNFLAHIYLSSNDPKIMVGNFIGDFVKGRNFFDHYEPEIARGIELHRMIDEYTDRHAVVQQSKMKLRQKYRHYAAVIVDIFYDHFLARYWNDYHDTPLIVFAKAAYNTIGMHNAILPIQVQGMLPYMIKDNWLVNYGTFQGIGQALTGISRRTTHESKMDESIQELKDFYEEFKAEFTLFMPDVKHECELFLKRINS
jgi:acyl carrier protein phosphodiesterase